MAEEETLVLAALMKSAFRLSLLWCDDGGTIRKTKPKGGRFSKSQRALMGFSYLSVPSTS